MKHIAPGHGGVAQMVRATAAAVALAGLLGGAAACSGGSAQQVLETAELEEKQNAVEHAKKLYREIIDRYPGSPEAKQAEARLQALAASK